MTTKVKLALGAALALALLLFGSYVRGLADERQLSQARINILEQSNLALTLEAEAGRQALEAREEQVKTMAEESRRLKEKLNEVYANDAAARAWADCTLPDAVACLLR